MIVGRNEPVRDPRIMALSARIVDWSSREYHEEFLAWLTKEADRPIDPSRPYNELVAANVRANTMKEIRAKLVNDEERARTALELEHG